MRKSELTFNSLRGGRTDASAAEPELNVDGIYGSPGDDDYDLTKVYGFNNPNPLCALAIVGPVQVQGQPRVQPRTGGVLRGGDARSLPPASGEHHLLGRAFDRGRRAGPRVREYLLERVSGENSKSVDYTGNFFAVLTFVFLCVFVLLDELVAFCERRLSDAQGRSQQVETVSGVPALRKQQEHCRAWPSPASCSGSPACAFGASRCTCS